MGLIGKAINNAKIVAKSVDSKLGEGVDVTKTRNKISEEKTKIDKSFRTIGECYYASVNGTDPNAQVKIDAAIADINASKVKIAEYESEITDIKGKGKEERKGFKNESE